MKKVFEEKSAATYSIEICIAADYDTAVHTCRTFCFNMGLCVTVTKTKYVYTGGAEDGVIIRLINYPRFSRKKLDIFKDAKALGHLVAEQSLQGSFLIIDRDKTFWFDRRVDACPDQ